MNEEPRYNSNIHHRRSIRLKGYDYSQAGLYFITICCQDRACLFGEIVGAENFPPNKNMVNDVNGANHYSPNNESPKMILNDAGKITNECWMEIPKHFPNAVLHEHIVMPNHVHGIIELISEPVGAENFPPNKNGMNDFPPNKNRVNDYSPNKNGMNDVNGAENFPPLRVTSKTIGSIVRGFKIGVTKWFRNNADYKTIWQRNYHEHIIRNEKSYKTISEYIINNPAKWQYDKFYKQ
jgi:REP element-mobilizing transposase RayT